ncbi:MAG TPA: DUF1700 domain-containing protein [Candidatus Limivivens intestinipullorum]|uniref:DUF1700 domain-containing protein n=1 Tax=Candidatus Limivivens intestinipullorum TaxID=2840858 RepID=A0A9D1EQH2_9FIRM|nr:DUF1700 domain-containing protein [Candidatus Limivivens intestinipullorum]
MRKDEYLNRLEWLLQDIPESDREEALSYYRDYFEDAGEENEEAVIEALGIPEKLAAIIREDVKGQSPDVGEFTDTGYEDPRYRENSRFPNPYRQPAPTGGNARAAENGTNESGSQKSGEENWRGGCRESEEGSRWGSRQENGQWNWQRSREENGQDGGWRDYRGNSSNEPRRRRRSAGGIALLILILLFFGVPVLLPAAGVAVSVICAVFALAAVIVLFCGVGGLAAVICGIVLLVIGIVRLFGAPVSGFFLGGIGLISFGGGLLLLLLAIRIVGSLIPALCRGVARIGSSLFRRGGRRS